MVALAAVFVSVLVSGFSEHYQYQNLNGKLVGTCPDDFTNWDRQTQLDYVEQYGE